MRQGQRMQWRVGPFRLDLDNACLWQGEERVGLRPKTFDLLAHLVEHSGKLVSKDELFTAVWPETVVSESTLTASMSELRKVLGETARAPQYIATVHRRGYRFIAPVTPVALPQAPPEGLAPAVPPSGAATRTLAVPRRPSAVVVGRETELAQLHACFVRARQGDRQVVFITGEAGIGKTTLVDAFVDQMPRTPVPWIGHGQCIEHYGAGEPYLPLLEAFGQLCRGPEGAHLIARLTQQAPSWLMQMPALLSAAEYDTLQRRVADTTRERMLRELAEAVEMLTTERPLVLVLEDLHWSDASTLEWLAYVARRRQPARLLVLGTYRPIDAIVREHPVRVVTHELLVHGQCHQVVVGYLSEAQVGAYLTLRLGTGPLGPALAPLLHQRSTGNPLFLVTMVDEMVRQGVLHEGAACWELAAGADVVTLAVPESVRHLLTQQLEQLPRDAQALLEAASVMGKAFAVVPVAAALERPPEEVEEQCAVLARRGQWLQAQGLETWPDGTVTARFAFLHDLYRETAYGQVPMSRQARWHQQIGLRLERGYVAKAREMAAELAEHFVRGRDISRAVLYLEHAGDNARQRSALHEAATHLRLGLEILTALPELPERMEHELTLLFTLGLTLSMMQGQAAPEVGHVYERARVLCQQLDDTPRLFHILMGLRRFYSGRGALQTAQAVAEQLDELAQRSHDPEHLMEADFALGLVSFCLGDLALCRAHIGRGLALDVPLQPHTPLAVVHGNRRASCLNYAALALWGLGYPDQALQQSQDAVALSQQSPVPSNLAFTLHFAACLRQLRREAQEAERLAAATMTLATDYELGHWLGQSTIIYGWAIAAQGQREAGLEHLRQGLTAMDITGSELLRPYYLALLAEVYGDLGQPTAGLATLEDAWSLVNKNSERWYAAELHRLQGVLLLQQGVPEVHQAEQCFQQALHLSRTQQARNLELRVARSLSRLWQQQGKRDEARELLAPIYGRFTEGFDTADLQDAKALLDELR